MEELGGLLLTQNLLMHDNDTLNKIAHICTACLVFYTLRIVAVINFPCYQKDGMYFTYSK